MLSADLASAFAPPSAGTAGAAALAPAVGTAGAAGLGGAAAAGVAAAVTACAGSVAVADGTLPGSVVSAQTQGVIARSHWSSMNSNAARIESSSSFPEITSSVRM
ncbi:MAG: hypothetical protein EBV48_06995 [Betaproteobacteria bacterium]|nr:hypothetical protein [Betaproteobacteria bacterium]